MKLFWILVVFHFYIPVIFSELKLVIEIFRTGARSNVYDFNKWADNPNIEEITEVGIHQHFILGSQLRQKYIQDQKFLSSNFTENEFLIYSTNFNRTIESVISHMFGFYPEKKQLSVNKTGFIPNILSFDEVSEVEELSKETYTPFPIHILNDRNNFMLKALKCKGFNLLVSQNKENNEILEAITENFHETFTTIGRIMGIEKFNFDKLFKIMDGFSTDIFANRNLPSDIDFSLWPKLKFLYALYWPVNYFDKEINRRFSNTIVFDFILNVIDKKFKKSQPFNQTKYVLIGAHDINLIHLMIGLNFTSSECIYSVFYNSTTKFLNCETIYPSFASNIIIELHQNNKTKEYFVKVAYNGVYKYLCMRENTECSFSEFTSRLSEYKLANFDELCYSEKKSKKFIFNLDYTKKLLIYVIAIVETTILLILAIIFFRMKMTTEEKEPLKQFFNMGAAKT